MTPNIKEKLWPSLTIIPLTSTRQMKNKFVIQPETVIAPI
jgi:hypothetical protein